MADWLRAHPGGDLPRCRCFRERDNGEHVLSRGFHRAAAYAAAGRTRLPCEVFEGSLTDAAASNVGHGLKRTNDDKRRAVVMAFDAAPDWSDRRIADHCGVSHPFVAEQRRQVVTVTTSTRVGRDGKGYPADAGRPAEPDRRHAAQVPECEPTPPPADDLPSASPPQLEPVDFPPAAWDANLQTPASAAVSDAEPADGTAPDEGPDPEPPPADEPPRRPLPRHFVPGNKVDPDHPFAELMRAAQDFSARVTVALAADDEATRRLKRYLTCVGLCRPRALIVGEKKYGFHFTGLRSFRRVVKLAGLPGGEKTKAQLDPLMAEPEGGE